MQTQAAQAQRAVEGSTGQINSHNEWDRLREVIVGRAEGHASLVFSAPGPVSEAVLEQAVRLAREAFPHPFFWAAFQLTGRTD